MKSFGTKLVLLVEAAAVTAMAATDSANASPASSVVNELKEQLRLERELRETMEVEHRDELKQLQDEVAMWKESGVQSGDRSVVDNVKVGGGSGSSFFDDVVERQHSANKQVASRSQSKAHVASSSSSSPLLSLSASSSSLVVPSSQQQQRRLKSDKKNPFQPLPMPKPLPPNTIDPECYPETTMNEYNFFDGDTSNVYNFYDTGYREATWALIADGATDFGNGFLNWPFNRGMSAITVGGAYSGGGNPPTIFTIVVNGNGGPDGETDGINIAAAQFNEIDNTGDPSYKYKAQQSTDQLTNLGTVTAVTFIPPYVFNQDYQSWQPDTADLNTIYFLVGSANGDVYKCSITPGTKGWNLNLTPTCNGFDSLGYQGSKIGNISEMLYIPQIQAVVIMTFAGAFYSYSLTFDSDNTPTIETASSNIDYLNTEICNGCTACSVNYFPPVQPQLPRSLAAVYVDKETTYLYAAGLYPIDCFFGGSAEGAPIVIFNINGTDSSLRITHVSTIVNTFLTYQIVPAPTGIYFAAGGAGVFYIPYRGQDASHGMLGSKTPTIYQAYGIPNRNNVFDDYNDNRPKVTVTSITYTANPNNVVVYVEPGTRNIRRAFQGGALFISYVESCDTYIENSDYLFLSNGCVSSISTRDTCTGQVSLFVDNNVLGPVYTSIVDVNMNLWVQNGQGGLSIFSLAYTPGFDSALEWIKNSYYQNSCSCTPAATLLAEILAGVSLVLAIVALPEVLPEVAASAVAYAGLGVATAGVAVTFAPVVNGGRLLLPSLE